MGDSKISKIPTGIPFLDRLLCGGQVTGETYGVLGPIGVGKSTLAAMLAGEGAMQLGEKAGEQSDRRTWILVNLDGSKLDSIERVVSHSARISRSLKRDSILSILSSTTKLHDYEKTRAHELPRNGGDLLGECERWERVCPVLTRHFRLVHLANHATVRSMSPCEFIRNELDRLVMSGTEPAGVVIDYAGVLVNRYVEFQEHNLSWELEKFVRQCRSLIAVHFDIPVWIVHQLKYSSGGKPPGILHNHRDAANCQTFADDLTACFVLGTHDRENGCFSIRCTKSVEQPPTIEPTILGIDPDFATLRERPDYELNSLKRIVPDNCIEIDVPPSVWEEIQRLPGS